MDIGLTLIRMQDPIYLYFSLDTINSPGRFVNGRALEE